MLRRALRSATALAGALTLGGCSAAGGAPAIPIFGSFFPAWIICAVGGIIVAVIIRALLIGLRIDEHLPAPPLVYLCLAISGGIAFWLIWSGAA